jgi:hypothetical protein
MGNKFVEKHKRKSVLAALLFLFQGRVKYVSILLIVMILSVPFVVSSETIGRIIELRPVAAFLRGVGLGSVLSSINPGYNNDMMKAALANAAENSAQDSFWNKFLKRMDAAMPVAGSPSSMDMIRGGGPGLFGLPKVNDGTAEARGPGQVKGVVNAEERAKGDTGADVDLHGLLAGGSAGGESGLYGDVMGQNLAGRFSDGGSSSDNSPYVNPSMFKGAGSTSGGSAGMYNSVMAQAASKVPMPGSPQKVKAGGRLGRVSGFSWRNVGYRSSSAKMDVRINSKKPMFQLAETFAMTASAFKSPNSALEYQTAYTGSTYDGNDVNADAIQTADDSAAPVVPDTSFTGDLINGTQEMQQLAQNCSNSQGTNGAQMSADGKNMDDVAHTLGSPPKCCDHGAVSSWNGTINRIVAYCNDYNSNETVLAAQCQNADNQMDCGSYSKMHINPCSKWSCWLGIILAILLIVAGLAFGIGLLAIAGLGLLVFQMVPGMMGMVSALIAGLVGTAFIGTSSAQNALATAQQINSGDDGSKAK